VLGNCSRRRSGSSSARAVACMFARSYRSAYQRHVCRPG
jgi:hypothetical protein